MPVLGAGAVQASAPGLSPVPRRRVHIPELEEAEQFAAGRGRALRLLEALYQCVAAHSELLCYFVIVLNHMVTASATSLVLPVLVFLWAMLSIPRPSKRFWMTAIIFTEVGVAGGVGMGELLFIGFRATVLQNEVHRTFLMVQRIRICLPMQGPQV